MKPLYIQEYYHVDLFSKESYKNHHTQGKLMLIVVLPPPYELNLHYYFKHFSKLNKLHLSFQSLLFLYKNSKVLMV